MSKVVIVAGAGRSGTSTLAGVLSMLGLHLPEPQVPADDTNPRGFYESQWVVDFHKALLVRDPVVRTLDSRPEAAGLAATHVTPSDLDELDEWLSEALAAGAPVVVKDPRVFWFHDLWRTAATSRGAEVGFATMLRHPVEVAKSRDTHYTPTDRGERFRRQRATANIAGWVNACLVTEEITRADARVFARYADLLESWRPVVATVSERLGLGLDLEAGAAAVDAFVEPSLRRSETTWDSVDVPDTLRAVAEATWEQMNLLVDDPDAPAVPAALAAIRADFERLHDHAVGVALDHTQAREVHVRRRTRGNVREDYESRIAELEQQLDEAHHGTGDEDVDDRRTSLFGRLRG